MATIQYLQNVHDFDALGAVLEQVQDNPLRSMPLHKRMESMALLAKDLLVQLSKSDSPFSQMLALHAQTLGYSLPMLRWGFAQMLSEFSLPQMRALLQAQAPKQPWGLDELCPQLTLVTASTVPPAAMQDLLLALFLAVPVVFRPSGRHQPFFRSFLLWLNTNYAEFATCVALVSIASHETDALKELLAHSHTLSLASGHATLQEFQRLCTELNAQAKPRIVAFSHRVSAVVISAHDLCSLSKAQMRALAFDIRAWDLQGCLSPHYIFIEGAASNCVEFVKTLRGEIVEWEVRLKALPLSEAEYAKQNMLRREYALDALYYAETEACALILFDKDAGLSHKLIPNTVCLYPCSDAMHALKALEPFGQCLASSSPLSEAQIACAKAYGFHRFCAIGRMQKPSLLWLRDGVGQLSWLFEQ